MSNKPFHVFALKMSGVENMEIRRQNWVIKRYLAGMPARQIASHLQISIRATYQVIQHYKTCGKIIFAKQMGRPKQELNLSCKEIIRKEWQIFQCGSVKLHTLMKRKGFGVSQRKIQQVMDEYNLTAPCPKRRGQRKYCSYRWPKGFVVLHTDWTICPITKKQLIAFIDDHSRFILGYGLYEKATTENVLNCLYKLLFEHGIPYAIITDRGSCFYANKLDKHGNAKSKFQETLEQLGIKHIVARAHHPQTNGKIERWFGTYKREFNERFKNIDEYVDYYNNKRPHQRIDYKTPTDVFFKKDDVQNF